MGRNWPDFLLEANRVLKDKGLLIVSEVLSRFDDVNAFVKGMRTECGFKALKVTKLKEFFYLMIFEKVSESKFNDWSDEFAGQLKPCLYKKR